MKIEKRSCFDGGLEGRKSYFLDELEELRVKGFCSGERIRGSWVSHLFSLLIHEANGIVFRAHIITNESSFRQGIHHPFFLDWVVKRGFFLGHG
jgi:hypothetical protein